MIAIAIANFANSGNVTACARKNSKARIMLASLKWTSEIAKRTLVLDPPKPREEHGNRLEAAYRATKEAN
jgi:hypothetical protein